MAAATVDVGYLVASYSLPESTLNTLLDAPTVDLVHSLLQQVEAKAREHDEVKAEKLRADVELENAVRSGETRARALKATVDKGLKDVEELRRQLNEEENARAQLETELNALKSSSSSSSSEVQILHSRIATLEASNRDVSAALDAKSTAHDRLAEELSAQHQKILILRREVSELEERNQSLENSSMSTKFREQALQQEVELLKKNNDWYEGELKTRNTEYAKYRKEKGTRIAELQRLNEDSNQTIEALRRTETTLRQRLDEINQKAEDSLQKIQQLEEAAGKQQESFRLQLDSAQRLADLQKQSADTAKARLQEVQDQLDQLNDNAAEELGQLQAELETERSQREAAENKIAELELQVEGLESQISEMRSNIPVPGTPRRPLNGSVGTPGRAGSPSVFSPGASRLKGGPTMTQLYSENSQLKADLEITRQRNEALSTTVDEMLQELENKQPEIEELRAEHERLTSEVGEISALLDEATKEKESARKEARKCQGENQGITRECEILRQQLRDLSAQIKLLLVEGQAQAEGLESLNAAQQAYMEQLARGEIDEAQLNDMTDTGRLISRRLVLFKSVQELQTQNIELLRTIREVADQYEGTEAKAKSDQMERDREELERLREKNAQYEDQLQSLKTRSESFMKERDMFRRMLTHRGQLPPGTDAASMFGQSVDERAIATPPPGNRNSVDQSPRSKEISDYAKLVKEMQAHFDAYRQETATDHASLKQQVDKLARDKGELQGEIARISSQLTLAHERYELLQSNFTMLKSENVELQKRSQSLQEVAARQDLRTQQVAEELVEAKGLADGMRNENANLKAERELWKKIESRITEDNRSLMDERSRLNKMISDLQNLQNERELSESENRRRLQSRAESLEAELQTVKRKLDDEREENKKASLRREYEQEQTRTRIDDLVKSLSNTREELVVAKTLRDQLQARVDEMKIELRNAEERAQALQPRPTPRNNGGQETSTAESIEDGLSREQELAVEVSNLKRDLELARTEVEAARTHVEQYKAISQASEEELQSLNETNDQYREEMDQILAEKDAKIDDLERRVEEISAELATTNRELSEIRRSHEESNSQFNHQREILESEVLRLKDDNERFKETAKLHQEDLKAQAEIARQAQQSYENELVKHGEATKNLRDVREDYNKLKTEVAELKAQSEAARSTLAQSEDHWAEARERYERELTELRKRNDDIKAQNKILHQQLDNVSEQIAGLKHSRVSVPGAEADATTPQAGVDNLQELIRYLRQEKEIVDVQYELSIQETKRLRQQLDVTQNQLDQTREKLNAERQSLADKEQNAMSYSKLRETIDELNLYRESATTLRNEARQAQAQLAEKAQEVESLLNQIQPLQTRVREVESELESKDGELQLLQQDRDRWQKRTQDILQKYDRVDPAELEGLKTQIETLRSERDQAIAEKQPLQEQVDGFDERLRLEKEAAVAEAEENWQQVREKLIRQTKDRDKLQRGKIAAAEAERDDLKEQLAAVNAELESARSAQGQLELLREEHEAATQSHNQQLANVRQELEAATLARDEAIATAQANSQQQVGEQSSGISDAEKQSLESMLRAAENKANEESNRAVALHIQAESLQGRVRELENQAGELQQRISTLNNELSNAQTKAEQAQERVIHLEAQLEKSRQPRKSEDGGLEGGSVDRDLKARPSPRPGQLADSDVPPDELQAVTAEDNDALMRELAARQKEMEDLRTSTAIALSAANVVEDGSKDVAEQISEQVARIRVEMEVRLNEQVQQYDALYKKRADWLRLKVNERLNKYKEPIGVQIKEATQNKDIEIEKLKNEILQLKSEHDAEVQRLKVEHQADVERLERLKSEHAAEVERLKSDYQTQIERIRGDPSVAKDAHPSSSTAESVQPTGSAASGLPIKVEEMSEMEIKQFVDKTPAIKEIMKRNLKGRVDKLKEEQERVVTDLKQALQQAENKTAALVDMETKKQALKLNMADRRYKTALAKIEVVQQAATETPERSVGEVWDIAKLIGQKPAQTAQSTAVSSESSTTQPTVATPTAQATVAASTAEPTATTSTIQPIATASAAPPITTLPTTEPAASISVTQPSPATQSTASQSGNASQIDQVSSATSKLSPSVSAFGQPVMTGQGQTPAAYGMYNQYAANQQPNDSSGQNGFGGMQSQMSPGFGGFNGGLPQPGFMGGQPFQQNRYGQNSQQGNFGTGPAALRNLAATQAGQTGIPLPSSGIPRPGGGRNQGNRPNQQNQNYNIQGAGGRGNNQGGDGGLNPNAQQFQPRPGSREGGRNNNRGYQKRGRDEEGNEGGGNFRGGKRARGGGAGR
ncbi:hypothetical protein GQ43DRAFT_390192 [Delitschia confertaspora ATCC 74209]|uniref:Nucleoprotein TPR/MLP1 domain-containing protein n=1 Tax=Delitschia confertaspora ATCC 74209 TaxID=1513339 RepID=A0A9P4JQ66_9PLEO|nr:hypothetical protein GQ43DRAFT_390192 [Delitschia confertaspora ATCC 74209]